MQPPESHTKGCPYESGAGWATAAPHADGYAYVISNQAYAQLLSAPFGVNAGSSYDIYAHLRGQLDAEDSAQCWAVEVHFYNSYGGWLWGGSTAYGCPGGLSLSWQRKGGRVTAPTGAATARIQITNYMFTGWLAIDDVEAYRVTNGVPGGANLAPDGSFDIGGQWTENRGASFPATSFYRSNWGTAAPRSGGWAYAISNQVYTVLRSQPVAVRENTSYEVSAHLRGEMDVEAGNQCWLLRVDFYTSSGGWLSNADPTYGCPGTLSQSWRREGGQVTTPPGAASLRLTLFDYMTSSWIAYDEASVRRVANGAAVGPNLLPDPSFEVMAGQVPDLASSTQRLYYYAGGQRVAVRAVRGSENTLIWLLGDHLGSTALVVNESGAPAGELRYRPWGEARGSVPSNFPTTFRFTGQRAEPELDGLYFYQARWYDSYLNRWLQPDDIVPDPTNPLAYDRYSYVYNNPINNTDPSGHDPYWCGGNQQCIAHHYVETGYIPWKDDVEITRPTKAAPDKKTGIDVLRLFMRLNSNAGWWNNNTPYGMTTEQLLGMAILWERGQVTDIQDELIDASGRHIWFDARSLGGHAPYCNSATCRNGVFNFLAAYAGKHSFSRFTLTGINQFPMQGKENFDNIMSTAGDVGTRILSPNNTTWADLDWDAPYHWGNNKKLRESHLSGWILTRGDDFLMWALGTKFK